MTYYVVEPVDPANPTAKRKVKSFDSLLAAYLYQKDNGGEMLKVIEAEMVEKKQ